MLREELDGCNLKLMELEEAVQKFSEENNQLAKPLAKKLEKVMELHQQTIRQAENQISKLNQVCCSRLFLSNSKTEMQCFGFFFKHFLFH